MRKNAGAGKTALAGAVSVAMALTLGVPTTALADNWGGGVADSAQRASETRSLETDAAGAIGGENAATAQAAEPAATADAPAANATGVAVIGDQPYDSLKDAFAAAPATEVTVVLTDDIVMSTDDIATVKAGTSVILDMAGHSITVESSFSGRPIVVEAGATLTVTGNGTIDSSAAGNGGWGSINNFGTLTIENGTFRGALEGNAVNVYNRAGGTMTINGGTFDTNGTAVATEAGSTTAITGGYFKSPWYPAIENNGTTTITGGEFVNTSCSTCDSAHWGYTIRSGLNSNSAYLRIDDATVTGTQGGVSVVGGTADIYDGVFKTVDCPEKHGAVFYALYVAGESYETSTTVHGGTFSSEKREAVWVGNSQGDGGNEEEATLVINGGSFTGGGADKTALKVDQSLGGLSITSGEFSSQPDEAWIAEGVQAGQDADGNWVVQEPEPVASVNGEEYASFEAAIEAAQAGDTVTLLADAETQPVVIDEGIVIDLGGKKLSIVGKAKQDDAGITFTNGASTIKNGSIVDTCQIARTFAVVIDGSDAALTMEDATLTVEVPKSGDGYGMRVLNGAEPTLNDGAVVNSAPVSGNTGYIYGVNVYGNDSGATFDEATASKLTVNEGATIEAYAFAVSGNGDGTKDNTLITVNGGTLISEAGPAIYHPQYGKLVINGGTLDGCSGVEIRAGELEVNGGTIKGDTNKTIVYPKESIGGSNSVDGGGIIVAQHSTKLPVKVTVNGGTIEANTAFIQHNVMGNDQESIDKIEMSITGGEFVGALRSDNFKDVDGNGFVSGGSFSDRAVGDFLAHDAAVAVNDGETPFDVYPSEDEALANGGAHKVVDEQKNSWIFSDEDAANDFAETVTGGKVEVVTRSVTFDDGIDATKDAVVAVPNGDPVAAPADPERDGYTFAGWFSDEACTQAWDFESPVTSDMTLYAKWAKVGDEGGEGPIIPIEPGDEGDGQKDDAQKDEAEGGLAGTGDAAPLAAAGAAAAVAALVAGGAAVAARRRG